MKIYLVERTDIINYDEYDSWVVVAKNKEEAKLMCKWYADNPELLVKEIRAVGKPRLILGSFNAG